MASSLSADTKDALARDIPGAVHCQNALLRALTYYGRSPRGRFATQRNAVARLVRTLLLKQNQGEARIEKEPGKRLARTPVYSLEIPHELSAASPKPMHKCDRIMEVRGAFLACGSLSASGHGYHL